ncbi:MAG: Fur family transcriptional regulator [Acidimicrobiaceae bacterium]|nr:Fur family transcriptional regulator [Acidimicrobiaceae bacterium]MDE0319771.1 Fur family transcriptional regulator [Acidimicrobiaceae bacterium]MDE0497993.1 Fur family transcriptional regulator [Acidimicrobiaceae bacterium]
MNETAETDAIHAEAERRLRSAGQRYTDRRRALVARLATASRPLTLPEIVSSSAGMPQSSAYRNLYVLEQSGLVHRITVGGDRAWFELAESLLGHHHHLICVVCGAIADMHLPAALEEAVDRELHEAASAAGFTALHHNLDLYGHCPACRDTPSAARTSGNDGADTDGSHPPTAHADPTA